ncbi:MAG: nitrate/nitrite two-component system sensor histidine kinase NarQ [Shewanella sp.]|jgi:two-component system nitrate/nitrite sensor histidine kinase NarQ|uniref:nitrate/nitrite two-component system sensor histidine kinase NarQ n=1 Tax=unclassified Shewanella TaxID=196818 RepID=UPI000C31EDB7|nr:MULTISPECIES: nitrate/nitrite two-component system sensor histidine kinase NarQ [unclassified Shewanella]MBB1360725.1 nitrate/nitrite two-component system sensor histidine kinase NarQ [Shewanella sp. SR44-4]MBO1898156.1 nitrate/nitrite two-component system sensor histidine kinase NarQ [Shewanella sp. BF02_Schw]PKH34822.1 nitrate/nitrite two-component system sensor histidine kinase NarQ [Shewanella sp. ALD9]
MFTRGSLTSTILSLMLILILLSSSLAVFSIVNLTFSLGDAKGINASGSLRMQSYRLLLYTNAGSSNTDEKITAFENTLSSEALKRSLQWYSPKELRDQYLLVIDKWQVMRVYIEEGNTRLYSASLTDFVDTIDTLVLKMELFAAFKLKLLVIGQIIGLFILLVIAFFAVVFTRKRVVKPLQLLMDSAATISKGNFKVEMPKTGYIELTALGNALQKTAAELAHLYEDLENQVNEKTLALTRANNELKFLYDNLLMLHADKLDYKALQSAINQLKYYEDLTFLRLVVEHDDGSKDVIKAEGGWPDELATESVQFPLLIEKTQMGYLDVISNKPLNKLLFENFAMMLTRSITIHNATEQRQQLALLEERAVIARELHDSIGQLLSFLKIQVSLLRKSLAHSCRSPEVEGQLTEINEGVSTAYVQLRELLSTFRLTIKEPNLSQAIEVMLDQLRHQTNINIQLNYKISAHLLEAKQHIHILQLIREATLNAIKHANPAHIVVDCQLTNNGMITITICDDGIGVTHLAERDQHFGIGIMHERANKLNGIVSFNSNQLGGTTVTLSFPPQQEPLNG